MIGFLPLYAHSRLHNCLVGFDRRDFCGPGGGGDAATTAAPIGIAGAQPGTE
jgi:hypothetical protein